MPTPYDRSVFWLRSLGLALVPFYLGCGGSLYYFNAQTAESRLETARALNAEQLAPYEFYYADAHLAKAQEEAAQANYGDASDFAVTSAEFAQKAIELSKGAHQGAGR